jgi:hypothetical protein
MSAHIAPTAANVVPLRHYPPGDACLLDVARRAHTTGQHLVTNGTEVYITPMVMPGEFPIPMRIKEAA